MRLVAAEFSKGDAKLAESLQLFGPDDTGVLDTSAAIAQQPVHARLDEQLHGESGYGLAPYCGPLARDGVGLTPYGEDALAAEVALVPLLSNVRYEYGNLEFGATAIDRLGNDSGAPTGGHVLVIDTPQDFNEASAAVTLSVSAVQTVTMTIVEKAEV